MDAIAGHGLALYAQLTAKGWEPARLARLHEAYKLGIRISYPLVRANWKPFAAHLVGTASIAAWDTDDDALLGAALVHSALEFGVFPAGIDNEEQKLAFVATGAGAAVADLVRRYNASRHTPLLSLTPADAAQDKELAHLRLANALDDIIDELGPIRTHKQIAELSAGPEGFTALAGLATSAGAPRLASAYGELVGRQAAPEAVLEPGRSSFRLDAHKRGLTRWFRR